MSAISASCGAIWRRAKGSDGARSSGCTGAPYRKLLPSKTRGISGLEHGQVALGKIRELHRGPAFRAGQPGDGQLAQEVGMRDGVDHRRSFCTALVARVLRVKRRD